MNNNQIGKKLKISNSDQLKISNKINMGWTTWLNNAKLNLNTFLESNQINNSMKECALNSKK